VTSSDPAPASPASPPPIGPMGGESVPIAPTRPSSHRTVGIVAGAVLVVVIVLVLLFAGILPGRPSSSPGAASFTESEQFANASASSLVASAPGGPFELVFAEGADRLYGTNETVSEEYGNTSCPLQGGTVTSLSLPAYTGNYSDGDAEAWLLGYYSSTGTGTALVVFATPGSAGEIGELSGPGCDLSLLTHPLSSGLVDSTAAADAAFSSPAGSAFRADYPQANVSIALEGIAPNGTGYHFTVPEWYFVVEAPCQGGVQPTFDAVVYASNATLVGALTRSGTCGPTRTPIGSAFAAGDPTGFTCGVTSTYAAEGCSAGDHAYRLAVEQSTVNLSSVLFQVRTATGANFTAGGPGGFSILNASGDVIAQSAASAQLAMGTPFSIYASGVSGSTPLTDLDTIVIDVGPSSVAGMGYTFDAEGTGAYGGTTSALALP
jgi:hypothetical protein